MYTIKEIKEYDRPRERMLNRGAQALSNEELLAILLRTGSNKKSALDLAKDILMRLDSFYDLRKLSLEEMQQIEGIKLAKATTIMAAIELGKRLSELKVNKMEYIKEAEDVYRLLHYELSVLEQEHFICLYLNTKGAVIKKETIFIGTINQTIIHPREVFKHAVRLSTAALLFVHNHPSGDSKPSKADYDVTDRLESVAKIFDIEVVDHIIIGKNEFYSIKGNRKIVM